MLRNLNPRLFFARNAPFCLKIQILFQHFQNKFKFHHLVIWQIFFQHFFWNFYVHVLLYKSSLNYNIELKISEFLLKTNLKTLKKFQISIAIQTGSMKKSLDKKKFKKFLRKKNLLKWSCHFFQIFITNPNFEMDFLSNLAISSAKWWQIWTLCIKINKKALNKISEKLGPQKLAFYLCLQWN